MDDRAIDDLARELCDLFEQQVRALSLRRIQAPSEQEQRAYEQRRKRMDELRSTIVSSDTLH
jgi:hypothetical protein